MASAPTSRMSFATAELPNLTRQQKKIKIVIRIFAVVEVILAAVCIGFSSASLKFFPIGIVTGCVVLLSAFFGLGTSCCNTTTCFNIHLLLSIVGTMFSAITATFPSLFTYQFMDIGLGFSSYSLAYECCSSAVYSLIGIHVQSKQQPQNLLARGRFDSDFVVPLSLVINKAIVFVFALAELITGSAGIWYGISSILADGQLVFGPWVGMWATITGAVGLATAFQITSRCLRISFLLCNGIVMIFSSVMIFLVRLGHVFADKDGPLTFNVMTVVILLFSVVTMSTLFAIETVYYVNGKSMALTDETPGGAAPTSRGGRTEETRPTSSDRNQSTPSNPPPSYSEFRA